MKLYFAPGTCALACWIALEWAGADYEVEKVDPGSDLHSWLSGARATAALVRPDHTVARSGRDVTALCEAVPSFAVS